MALTEIRLREDPGLVGKVLLISMLLAVVFVVVAIDAGSIFLQRFRAEDLAEDASVSAAEAFSQSGDQKAAKLAALDTIADANEEVRLRRIHVGRRRITIVLTTRAGTLVVGRIPYVEDLARLTITASSPLPPG